MVTEAELGITFNAMAWLTSYGPFSYGPNLIVWHSLECDAVDHIAEQLSARGGYLDNENLAPQRMTDPVSIVKTIPDGNQGGHIGGPGNSHCAGVEVSGRATWGAAGWATGNARAAVDHQARAVAGLAIVYGWSLADLRWLSIAEIRAGARGCCSHNDISISGISGTNHWDPGPNFDYAWAMERTRYWFQVMTGGNPTTPDVPVDENAWLTVSAESNIMTAISELPVRVWTKSITDEGANTILAAIRAGVQQAVAELTAAAVVAANPQGARYGAVRDDTTGAVYAVAPGMFWHIPGGSLIAIAQNAGLLDGDIHHTNTAGVTALRDMAAGGISPVYVPPAKPTTYTVKAGDGLIAIAAACGIADYRDLVTWNKLSSADAINPGDVLRLTP